jgi:hypothetical protein
MNSRESDFGVNAAGTGPADRRNPVAGGANDMYFAGMLSATYALQ